MLAGSSSTIMTVEVSFSLRMSALVGNETVGVESMSYDSSYVEPSIVSSTSGSIGDGDSTDCIAQTPS